MTGKTSDRRLRPGGRYFGGIREVCMDEKRIRGNCVREGVNSWAQEGLTKNCVGWAKPAQVGKKKQVRGTWPREGLVSFI